MQNLKRWLCCKIVYWYFRTSLWLPERLIRWVYQIGKPHTGEAFKRAIQDWNAKHKKETE